MLLIGNGASRRTQLLREACVTAGARLEIVEWRDLLAATDAARLLITARMGAHAWCKIETPGDDPALDALLIERGWRIDGCRGSRPRALAHGELGHRDLRFRGFAAALRALTGSLHGLHMLNDVEEILLMCDKWACQRHLISQGVPVPRLLAEVCTFEEFDARFPAREFPAVFIKSRYGSSAAGVVALRRHPDGRLAAYASARIDDGAIFNHLGVLRYARRADIARLVDAIAAQGAYAERWTPKPAVPGSRDRHYDLRVVASGGRARQRIARISRTPMTNLHLGNARAAPDWLSEIQLGALEDLTARAAAAFPRSGSIGFDLTIGARDAHVFEANAFGDLLPGLRFDGLTTYEDQARLARRDEPA